ncbi:MAG: hypothetical protein ACXWJG_18180, partial [Caldimonas sp.]
MVRLVSFALACLLALWSVPSAAAVYTGTFPTGDSSQFIKVDPTATPLEFDFKSDLANVSLSADLYAFEVFYGTIYMGPDNPPYEYGDYYDVNILMNVGPTGFHQIVDPHWQPCDPYKGPAYFCEHQEFKGIYLDASNSGAPVDWVLTITAVPEPRAWALMIL